ncbi:MAG: FAD-binding oxidoreductase, partial [Verrucomicrobia bacterium]
MKNARALSALREALGNAVVTDPESLFRASFDAMKLSFVPEAVILPSDPAGVGTVLKIANEFGVPITPRGAGSTLTGAATPIHGGWVLDLSKLNSIRIDPLNKFAHVQAGAITGDIQKAAEEHKLFYPPDPSSSAFCTIGGNIACNAGGLRGVKYGVTRDYVVAIKGFLANGEPAVWGRALKKFTSGYNVRDLWIGSEG